jgi:hypothetical protein
VVRAVRSFLVLPAGLAFIFTLTVVARPSICN